MFVQPVCSAAAAECKKARAASYFYPNLKWPCILSRCRYYIFILMCFFIFVLFILSKQIFLCQCCWVKVFFEFEFIYYLLFCSKYLFCQIRRDKWELCGEDVQPASLGHPKSDFVNLKGFQGSWGYHGKVCNTVLPSSWYFWYALMTKNNCSIKFDWNQTLTLGIRVPFYYPFCSLSFYVRLLDYSILLKASDEDLIHEPIPSLFWL